MPIYDYICLDCKTRFEFRVSLSENRSLKELGYDVKIPLCPKCVKGNVRKLITAPTIIYKGDGFTKSVQGNIDESTNSD